MIELLAPGGSPEGMRAALHAGADAIYMGGSRFGARAFAVNADEAGLLEAIDTCHLHGAKLYLTVNTLLRDDELEGDLYDFLLPYYERGLDAVLVQDVGVLRFIRREFPDLPVHASTQMTLTGADGAALLKELGAERIVPARELTLEEIREIRRKTDIEVECFVHGALCYCYSGQCLMSSMIGARSGNRGRCAQPCRLPYRCGRGEQQYLMSLKDICTLDILPELIDAGVCSLKIEGRMKQPEYAAGVTMVYRKYLDLLEEKGREGWHIDSADRVILKDLYCRGGFSSGYAVTEKGPEMMSMHRPNHQGPAAAKVLSSARREIRAKALCALHPGDVLEMEIRDREGGSVDLTVSADVPEGEQFTLALPAGAAGRAPGAGAVLHRTHDPSLLQSIRENFIEKQKQERIKGTFILREGESAILEVSCGESRAKALGGEAQRALTRALLAEDVKKQLLRTGDTPFVFESLEIRMDEGLFMPVQSIKQLRRSALALLEEEICGKYKRRAPDERPQPEETAGKETAGEAPAEDRKPESGPQLRISFETEQQAQAVLAHIRALKEESASEAGDDLSGILPEAVYADCALFLQPGCAPEEGRKMFLGMAKQFHAAGCRFLLALPPIWRSGIKKRFLAVFDEDTLRAADGFLAKSMEQLSSLPAGEITADSSLYTWNREARAFYKERGVSRDTVPFELTFSELLARGCEGSEIALYGRVPLMVTEQCVKKNTEGCAVRTGITMITDRKGVRFPVKNQCAFCFNMIFNSVPLDLRRDLPKIRQLGCASYRLSFTCESGEETARILSGDIPEQSTRGHFTRGVE